MRQQSIEAQVQAQLAQVLAHVRQHGHAAIHLAATANLSPVTFTAGGAAKGLPDLILYGLGHEAGVSTINQAFNVAKNLWPFENYHRATGVIANFEVVFRDVSRSDLLQRAMGLTAMFNRHQGYAQTPILQVCWPDKQGVFPYDPTCSVDVAKAQRVRGLRN